MYFDGCYFDPTYFDASECTTPPPSEGGSNTWPVPNMRRRRAYTVSTPDPLLDDEESLLILEGL